MVRLQDRRQEPRNRRSHDSLQVAWVDLLVAEIGLHVLKRLVMTCLLVPSGNTEHHSLGRTVFHPWPEPIVPKLHAAGRDREKNGFGECEDGVVLRVTLLAKRRLDLLLNRRRTVEQIDFRVCIGEAGHVRIDEVCTLTIREPGECLFGEEEDFFLFYVQRVRVS